MNIILYNNLSNNDVINKNITSVQEIQGNLKGDCSMLNPSFSLAISNIDFNYLYVPEFKRYYFVTDKVYNINGLIDVNCEVDVLYTYKDMILKSEAIVTRATNKANVYLPDSNYVVTPREKLDLRIPFNNGGGINFYTNADNDITDPTQSVQYRYVLQVMNQVEFNTSSGEGGET